MLEHHGAILAAAHLVGGYDHLRPGQEVAITALLTGHDTLAILPTGSGKSAIYQIAGHLMPGPTIVISPLIALQREQVESITAQGSDAAALVNSTITAGERAAAIDALTAGQLEFLFLAPEQLTQPDVLERLHAAAPSLFVVDEAHCISEWGHDFRPDYLRLGAAITQLRQPRVLALTATASPPVRADVLQRLGLQNTHVVVCDFDRPNIWLSVTTVHDEASKLCELQALVDTAAKPGIIHAATHKHAEEVAAALRDAGITAIHYHAGVKPKEREAAQQRFLADEADVIVATSAFGMGIFFWVRNRAKVLI